MRIYLSAVTVITVLIISQINIYAQNKNIYELRKYTDEDWLEMSTTDRLKALNTSNNHSRSQTFLGNFNREFDRYRKWGYDYYDMNDRYENYAFRGFESYRILENRRRKWSYNEFGDRLVKMSATANIWHETKYDDGTTEAYGPWNYINYLTTTQDLDGVWAIRESTDDWAVALMGAEKLRTIFTPLTLSTPGLTGMRVDFQSANYQASIVNSNGVTSRWSRTLPDNMRMIRGFHFRRRFGALNIGSTYVTNYYQQRTREKGDSWKGTLQDNVPTPMIYLVRVIDDSPWDGDGPVVYNVRLKVNGVYRDDIQPQVILDDLTWESISAVEPFKGSFEPFRPHYIMGNTNFMSHTIYTVSNDLPTIGHLNMNKPKYVDYMFHNDLRKGWNTNNLTHYCNLNWLTGYYSIADPAGKPLQVNGTKYVVYWFDISTITENVNRVQAEVTVSNDYRIQTSVIYTKHPDGGHEAKGDNQSYYHTEYWETMAVAEGNVKNESNIRTVKIDFGYEVGNTIYGFDANFDYYGCKIRGEYVTNTHYYMFPDGLPGSGIPMQKLTIWDPRTGHRSSLTDHAYYVTVNKDWKYFGLAGEYFKMGKFYMPQVRRLGTLIADNDDYDQYADNDDRDGVYPGFDVDHDGIPDTERNMNGIPDYYEPFLMFDADPENFAMGDDFDNNTVPDFREDDNYVDMPYDHDRKGYHFFLRFTPQKSVNFITGSLRTRGVGVDNRTFNDYAKFKLDYNVFTVGRLSAEYRYERIRDNIHDPYSVYVEERKIADLSAYKSGWMLRKREHFDKLEYRNSRVNKLFLESRIRAVPSVTLENFIKYERNSQIGGIMYDNTFQLPGILKTIAMSHKVSYTKQLGNWTLSSGIKLRFYKYDRSYHVNPEEYYSMLIPLTYVMYRISDDTTITFGTQGFNDFEFRYHDYLDDRNDYRQKNYILQVANRTNYFGFDVWGLWGFKLEQVGFDDSGRTWEDYKQSSFFLKMYTGY